MSSSKSNVEVKARLRSPVRQTELAVEVAGGPPTVLNQRDTFFYVPRGRLKLREIDPDTPAVQAQLIQYFRDDDPALRVSDYVLSPVSDPQTLLAALERSLGVRGTVEKKRLLWIVGQTRIHFDTVVGLGDFVELEFVLDEGQCESEGHEFASNLMSRLDIDREDVIECAYIDLIEQSRNG